MSNTDARTHNQPSHQASGKGGQNPGSGSEKDKMPGKSGTGTHNQPSHEAQVKGGQHFHSGSNKP